MAVKPIILSDFLTTAANALVIDVRSESEYKQAHIPGAHSLPLFNDEERKVVGTAYKQESREAAIKIGLDIFGPKMRVMVEAVEKIISESAFTNTRTLLLYCWRGGMRSAGVAWLLDLYGFDVYTLRGGYKTFRRAVLASFDVAYNFKVIGGYTGSGKTELLQQLKENGNCVIDLEKLANHRGSALGAIEGMTQPRQELFENLLSMQLRAATAEDANQLIYLEDESQRIGNLQIPMPIWERMRKAPVYFFDIPFDARLAYLTVHYGGQSQENLRDAVLRIQKRLGGLDTKTALKFLNDDDISSAFRILLRYYDKCYAKAMTNRGDSSSTIITISAPSSGAADNFKLLAEKIQA